MSEDAARVGPTNMWGTWEELILGSAVERHGTDDWNVIVSELRARTAYHDICTPEICKAKYEDLLARFSCLADLIEDLRNRRMDELRRDIATSIDNISSLESRLRSLQVKEELEDDSNNKEDNSHTLRTDDLMEIFNSISDSKAASVFKYRRHSQKRARYRELIKQHVDMESIRSKITEETIKSAQELFRDLLLLSNNALVFYSSRSREYKSALALRDLVKSEYNNYCRRSCNEAAPPIITPSFDLTVHKRRRSIRLRSQPPPPPPLSPNTVNSDSDDEEDTQMSEDDPSDDSDQDYSPRSSSFKGKKRRVLRIRAKPKRASGK